MTRGRGRPPAFKEQLSVRLPISLLAAIKSQHPELLKPGTRDFAHGKLSSWLERVLWKELRKPTFSGKRPLVRDSNAESKDTSDSLDTGGGEDISES